MALTIRCTGCRKKISVDDAFAGGVCRCPYCKEIVFVDKGGRAAAVPRPEAPGGEQPAQPGKTPEVVTGEVLADEDAYVPMANPIRSQGIATMVLIGGILAMVAGGIIVYVKYIGGSPSGESNSAASQPAVGGKQTASNPANLPAGSESATPATNPAAGAGQAAGPADLNTVPRIAGLNMLRGGATIYCIDDGASMTDYFDYARVLTLQSIRSLKPSQQTVTVMLAGKEKFMEGEYFPGGPDGAKKAEEFLQDVSAAGLADVGQAINIAFTRSPAPKTIIVLTHKPVDNASQTAQLAKERGIAIYAIALDGDAATRQSLTTLATNSAGGQVATPTQAELEALTSE